MGLRERLDAADDRAFLDVDVPEWGGAKVRLSEPTQDALLEIERLQDEWKTAHGGKDIPAIVIARIVLALTLIDPETGELVYGADGIGALAKRRGSVVLRLFSKTCDLAPRASVLAGESSAVPSGASSSS